MTMTKIEGQYDLCKALNAAGPPESAKLPKKGVLSIEYTRSDAGSFVLVALGESGEGATLGVALDALIRGLYRKRAAFSALRDSDLSADGRSLAFGIRALLGDAEPRGATR